MGLHFLEFPKGMMPGRFIKQQQLFRFIIGEYTAFNG